MTFIELVLLDRLLGGMDKHMIIEPWMVVRRVRGEDPTKLAEYFFGANAINLYNLKDPRHLELIGRLLCHLPFHKYPQSIAMFKHLMDRDLKLENLNLPAEHHMYILWMIGNDVSYN